MLLGFDQQTLLTLASSGKAIHALQIVNSHLADALHKLTNRVDDLHTGNDVLTNAIYELTDTVQALSERMNAPQLVNLPAPHAQAPPRQPPKRQRASKKAMQVIQYLKDNPSQLAALESGDLNYREIGRQLSITHPTVKAAHEMMVQQPLL